MGSQISREGFEPAWTASQQFRGCPNRGLSSIPDFIGPPRECSSQENRPARRTEIFHFFCNQPRQRRKHLNGVTTVLGMPKSWIVQSFPMSTTSREIVRPVKKRPRIGTIPGRVLPYRDFAALSPTTVNLAKDTVFSLFAVPFCYQITVNVNLLSSSCRQTQQQS